MSIQSYSPSLPLDLDENSRFLMNKDTLSNAKQKLKMILLTNPGEKLMEPDFGIGVRRYLFEPIGGILSIDTAIDSFFLKNLKEDLLEKLNLQIYKYSPDLKIENLEVQIEENLANISIFYTYADYVDDILTLTISG